MQIAQHLLVLFHLIGFAALLGGLLVQVRAKETEVNASMLNGSFTLLLTGLALVTVEALEADRLNYVKIAIKLLLMAVIVVLVPRTGSSPRSRADSGALSAASPSPMPEWPCYGSKVDRGVRS